MPGYEDFVRGLAGAGAALAGNVPAYERDQERQFRQGAVRQQLRQGDEAGQRDNARLMMQFQQLQQEGEIKTLALAKGTLEMINVLKPTLAKLSPEDQQRAVEGLLPLGQRMFGMVTRGRPEAPLWQGEVGRQMLTHLLTSPDPVEQQIAGVGDLEPGDIASIVALPLEPKEKLEEARKLSQARLERDFDGAMRKAEGTLLGVPQMVSLAEGAKAAGWTAREMKAVERLSGDVKFGRRLMSVNIMSPEFLEQRARDSAKPDRLGVEFARYARELYPDKDPNTLSDKEAAAVNARIRQERIDVSAEQGAAGMRAKAAEERRQPLVQSLKSSEYVYDLTTGREVDRFATSLEDIKAGGGSKRYKHLSEKEHSQITTIRESEALLGQYDEIVAGFTNQPGANFGQALTMWAKTRAGAENPGVALDALKGSVLRLAGAMQGSRVQLSDQDRKAVEGMLPTSLDTLQTGAQRLMTVRRLLSTMRDATLGVVSPSEFRKQIEALPTYGKGVGAAGGAARERWNPATGKLEPIQ